MMFHIQDLVLEDIRIPGYVSTVEYELNSSANIKYPADIYIESVSINVDQKGNPTSVQLSKLPDESQNGAVYLNRDYLSCTDKVETLYGSQKISITHLF